MNLMLNMDNYQVKEHLELLKNVYLNYNLNIMLSNEFSKKKENQILMKYEYLIKLEMIKILFNYMILIIDKQIN